MADRRRREDAEATPAADRRKTPRREAARMPVSLWAVEDDGAGIYYHHVRDLSSGGLFLEKGLTLPVGSRMQLELTLPTARSIRAEGVVVTSVSIEGAERPRSGSAKGAARREAEALVGRTGAKPLETTTPNERGTNKTSGNGIRFEKISDADRKAIEEYVLSSAR